jgi:hypothetical protein
MVPSHHLYEQQDAGQETVPLFMDLLRTFSGIHLKLLYQYKLLAIA